MDYAGLLMCAHYALPPNLLKYCGPFEKSSDLALYNQTHSVDMGLADIIKNFEVLYPYLTFIAYENNVSDPFDRRVVEAYWIGNSFLETISMKSFYYYLNDTLQLKKKIKKKDLRYLFGKIPKGALPHHNFHVLNVFKKVGNLSQTLEVMENCRIGWGKVIDIKSEGIYVASKPLVLSQNKLSLGDSRTKIISIKHNTPQSLRSIKENKWVSFHWNFLCDTITYRQVKNLEKYTNLSIKLANTTL